MMKNTRFFKLLCCLVCLFCIATIGVKGYGKVSAEEQSYQWDSVECISIAPPYVYTANGTVSFQVNFNKEITRVNYKHLAAGAEALKTFSSYDNPNLSNESIDSLDQSGVLDSLNDCIAFNGVKIRQLQKISILACMVHVGELGANNSMNIDINGDVPEVKINDLDQAFTFTFYAGLKFPSGVELKETVTWMYDYKEQTFVQLSEDTDPNDASFSVYYNGQQLTRDNNVVVIYDKKAFSFDNLYVKANDINATYEIDSKFETLTDGFNYVIIKCLSGNQLKTERLQIVFDLQQVDDSKVTELIISLSCAGVAILAGAAALTIVFIKRRKRA